MTHYQKCFSYQDNALYFTIQNLKIFCFSKHKFPAGISPLPHSYPLTKWFNIHLYDYQQFFLNIVLTFSFDTKEEWLNHIIYFTKKNLSTLSLRNKGRQNVKHFEVNKLFPRAKRNSCKYACSKWIYIILTINV